MLNQEFKKKVSFFSIIKREEFIYGFNSIKNNNLFEYDKFLNDDKQIDSISKQILYERGRQTAIFIRELDGEIQLKRLNLKQENTCEYVAIIYQTLRAKQILCGEKVNNFDIKTSTAVRRNKNKTKSKSKSDFPIPQL